MKTPFFRFFLSGFLFARCASLGLLLFVACVTLPETGQRVFLMTSPREEAQMGVQAFQSLKQNQKISTNSEYQQRVKRVADRLIAHVAAPESQWETVVFEDETPNAFALPGGKIGVHTGMLKLVENDAQLAAVMGHEIAHVTMRHSGQRFSLQFPMMLGYAGLGLALQHEDWKTQQLAMTAYGVGSQVFGVLPFSRNHEYEADLIGLKYMAKAGYDPHQAIEFWHLMERSSKGGKPPVFLSTHPSDSNRIARLQQALPSVMPYYQGIR